MKKVKLFLYTLLLCLSALPQTACSKENETDMEENIILTDAEQEVARFIERRNQAIINQDVALLDRMIADDFAVVHAYGGRRQTKAEWLADIESGWMRYYRFDMRDLEITIEGDVATATYNAVVNASIWGGDRRDWPFNNVTQRFQKTENGWIWIN